MALFWPLKHNYFIYKSLHAAEYRMRAQKRKVLGALALLLSTALSACADDVSPGISSAPETRRSLPSSSCTIPDLPGKKTPSGIRYTSHRTPASSGGIVDWDEDGIPNHLDEVNLPSEAQTLSTSEDHLEIITPFDDRDFIFLVEPGFQEAYFVLGKTEVPRPPTKGESWDSTKLIQSPYEGEISAEQLLDFIGYLYCLDLREDFAQFITESMRIHFNLIQTGSASTVQLEWYYGRIPTDGTWLAVRSDAGRLANLWIGDRDNQTRGTGLFELRTVSPTPNWRTFLWEFLSPWSFAERRSFEYPGMCYTVRTYRGQEDGCEGDSQLTWIRAYSGQAQYSLRALHAGLEMGVVTVAYCRNPAEMIEDSCPATSPPSSSGLNPAESNEAVPYDSHIIYEPDSPWQPYACDTRSSFGISRSAPLLAAFRGPPHQIARNFSAGLGDPLSDDRPIIKIDGSNRTLKWTTADGNVELAYRPWTSSAGLNYYRPAVELFYRTPKSWPGPNEEDAKEALDEFLRRIGAPPGIAFSWLSGAEVTQQAAWYFRQMSRISDPWPTPVDVSGGWFSPTSFESEFRTRPLYDLSNVGQTISSEQAWDFAREFTRCDLEKRNTGFAVTGGEGYRDQLPLNIMHESLTYVGILMYGQPSGEDCPSWWRKVDVDSVTGAVHGYIEIERCRDGRLK